MTVLISWVTILGSVIIAAFRAPVGKPEIGHFRFSGNITKGMKRSAVGSTATLIDVEGTKYIKIQDGTWVKKV